MSLTVEPHWIALEGAANVRDLGGLPASGGRRVRRGQVVRADSLHRLTGADARILADLGLRTVIDLRSPGEVEMFASTGLPDGVEVLLVPWRPPSSVPDIIGGVSEMSYIPLSQLYEQFVEANIDLIAGMFTVMADAARLPVLFHCFAGKDRTGITAALLLDVLGVPDEAIIADYTATDERRERFAELVRPEAARLGFSETDRDKVNPDLSRAPAPQMAAFLEIFRGRWGSAADFLGAAGVPGEQLDALRAALLEQA